MNEVLIATNNPGKAAEYRQMFAPYQITVKTLQDIPNVPKIDEDGTTFEENALIKARAVMKATGLPVVADDSGLMIDALDGAPGVHSARYAGDHDDEANIRKVLSELTGVPESNRTAHFHTTLVAVKPGSAPLIAEGSVAGVILPEPRGNNGFGYDPIFWVPQFNQSMAELTPEQKNQISHRGNAMRAFMQRFEEWWRKS